MDDISDTLAPKSDQLDAVELVGGPRDFTVARVVVKPGAEQPVSVYFEEFDRPWRPGKNQRRVLAYCWGKRSSGWTGKKVRLFHDPEVVYGGKKVGGARISHLSHIDGPKQAPVLESQGRPGTYEVLPLVETAPAELTPLELAGQVAQGLRDSMTEAEAREWGNRAHARGLLALTPPGVSLTLQELVTQRIADLATPTDEAAER